MKNKKLVSPKSERYGRVKQQSPYAHIDWQKATVLFRKPQLTPQQKTSFPSAKAILRALASAGEAGMIFIFHADDPRTIGFLLGESSFSPWETKKTVSQLAKQKYVKINDIGGGKVTVNITKSGLTRALTYELDNMHLPRPRKWDGKWREVIFDIPERSRRSRDVFRMRLAQLGLYRLQESVYVSPYPCFDEVEFLRELYGIPSTVRYLLVEKIENDGELKKYFGL